MKNKNKPRHQNVAIKGYLPIHIALPPVGDIDRGFSTFIFVKEHVNKSPHGRNSSNSQGSTLFVANAPSNGPIRTDLFLRALFEPRGEITRITVAQDPRKVGTASSIENGLPLVGTLFRDAALSSFSGPGLGPGMGAQTKGRGDGKFAHVVFASEKEMKKALKSIRNDLAEVSRETDDSPCIRLDGKTIKLLEKETAKLRAEDNQYEDDIEQNSQRDNETTEDDNPLTGIHAIAAEARRKACRHIPRQKLMQMCNDAMALFEHEEAETQRKAKLASEQPDEDGFITVTHSSSAGPSFGAANEFEATGNNHGHGRRAGKRPRKKRKTGSGAAELQDFYRFQLKETRKKEVIDLKRRFEEDLAKVKKLREEKAYRPF